MGVIFHAFYFFDNSVLTIAKIWYSLTKHVHTEGII